MTSARLPYLHNIQDAHEYICIHNVYLRAFVCRYACMLRRWMSRNRAINALQIPFSRQLGPPGVSIAA